MARFNNSNKIDDKGYFPCPKCNANCSFNPKYQQNRVCIECGWDERIDKKSSTVKQLSPLQEKNERKKKLPRMVGQIISPIPDILFTEADLKKHGKSLDDDRGCWGWADPELHVLRMTPNTYELHRRQFINTVAHETSHLSPKKVMTVEEFEKLTLEEWKEQVATAERLESYYLSLPTDFNEALAHFKTRNFSDGKVPVVYMKQGFLADPFGAGWGHGNEWFLEFQSYKNILYNSNQEWINDPRQPQLKKFKYPTYSAGWMRGNTRYENKKQFLKSRKDVDLFGSEIFADEDEDLAKQYYGW